MKRNLLFFMALVWAFSCGNKAKCPEGKVCFKEADAYMLYLNTGLNRMIDHLNRFSDQSYARHIDSARVSLDSIRRISHEGFDKSLKLTDFKGDTLLRERYKVLFQFTAKSAEVELQDLLAAYAQDSMLPITDQTEMEIVAITFDNRFNRLMDSLLSQQEVFAKEYGLELR